MHAVAGDGSMDSSRRLLCFGYMLERSPKVPMALLAMPNTKLSHLVVGSTFAEKSRKNSVLHWRVNSCGMAACSKPHSPRQRP